MLHWLRYLRRVALYSMFKKLLRDREETLVIAADGSTDLNYILVSHGVVEILVFFY
jgi:hypothetical protein